jgi:hypothetical protein
MAGEQLFFNSCEDVDKFFREGRPYFNEIYVEKMAQISTYFTRVDTETWPMNSGTEQKAFRFGRGFYDPCSPFKRVISERCEQNSCDSEPEVITRPGNDSYTFELLKREMVTEWFCVEDLLYRLFPLEEIMQLEKSNAQIQKSVHEEFCRGNYVGGSGHKWVAFADDDGSYCGLADDQAFFIEEYTGDNNAGFNLCFARVKCPVASLATISLLSQDMLDDALVDLAGETDTYRQDLYEATGQPLLDIIIPDPRIGRQMYESEKQINGNWDSLAGYDDKLAIRRLGISRIVGDYAYGYDVNALKFNADSVFNATLATYDENNPDTWPRLVRVPRYIRKAAELGCKYVQNPDYRHADFTIIVAYVPDALTKYIQPSATGYADVQMEEQNYAGDWEFRRPDWECNRWGKQGFFQAQFRMAMQIKDPTIMHTFLVRVDNKRRARGGCCPIITDYAEPAPIDCFTCPGVGEP